MRVCVGQRENRCATESIIGYAADLLLNCAEQALQAAWYEGMPRRIDDHKAVAGK